MKNKKFEIVPAQSNIEWAGRKVTGSHNGTIALKEGELILSDGKLTGGKLVVDTTSIKVLDITDPATNEQFAGHMASDDFFSSREYPEATLEIFSVKGNRVEGNLTIKGIANRIGFDASVRATEDLLTATAKLIIDRTKYEMKFRSGNFFKDLGDTLIYNDFELNVSVTAKVAKKADAGRNLVNMKTVLLTAFLSCTLLVSKAQDNTKMETQKENIAAISQVLESRYFKGIYEGDTTLLSTAYHPGTLLFGDVKGQPYAKTLEQYLDGVQNRQSPKDSGKPFKGEILNIRVINSIAVAEIKVTMYDFVYQEFLSFHRIDGRWLLVSKMISDIADQIAGAKSTGTPVAGIKTLLIATIHILPGFEKEVKGALRTMEIASNKETGCEQFVANTQKDSPQAVVVYEVYKNDEAFQLHKTSSHAKAFFEFVKGKIVNDKIETVFLTELNSSK